MADVKFNAFVNDVLESDGEVWLLKTAESHRREVESGEWETTARTFRDVRVPNGSGIDLSAYPKDSRISVTGFEVTVHTERNGTDYYNLVCWAESIELAVSAEPPAAKAVARKSAPARAGRR